MTLSELPVTVYCLHRKGVRLERCLRHSRNDQWVIRWDRDCLQKDGTWRYEFMPSSREAEFLKATRWDTPEEALEFWEQWVAEHDLSFLI